MEIYIVIQFISQIKSKKMCKAWVSIATSHLTTRQGTAPIHQLFLNPQYTEGLLKEIQWIA